MKNEWEKKEKTCSSYLSNKIFANSARVWTRSTSLSSFQRSNWSPTYILHLFHLEDTSLLFIFLSESVKVRFLARVDTHFCPRTTCCLLVLSSAHAQDRFTWKAIWIDLNIVIQDNNSDIDSVGSFLSKNRIFCSITRC
jgi:hypothetical protein